MWACMPWWGRWRGGPRRPVAAGVPAGPPDQSRHRHGACLPARRPAGPLHPAHNTSLPAHRQDQQQQRHRARRRPRLTRLLLLPRAVGARRLYERQVAVPERLHRVSNVRVCGQAGGARPGLSAAVLPLDGSRRPPPWSLHLLHHHYQGLQEKQEPQQGAQRQQEASSASRKHSASSSRPPAPRSINHLPAPPALACASPATITTCPSCSARSTAAALSHMSATKSCGVGFSRPPAGTQRRRAGPAARRAALAGPAGSGGVLPAGATAAR